MCLCCLCWFQQAEWISHWTWLRPLDRLPVIFLLLTEHLTVFIVWSQNQIKDCAKIAFASQEIHGHWQISPVSSTALDYLLLILHIYFILDNEMINLVNYKPKLCAHTALFYIHNNWVIIRLTFSNLTTYSTWQMCDWL